MKKYIERMQQKYNPQLVRIGHYFLTGISGVFAYSITTAILAHYFHWSNLVQWLTIIPMPLAFFLFVFGSEAHEKTLCERCASELPLDPGGLAETRYKPWLRREHWMMDHGKILVAAYIVLMLLFTFSAKHVPYMVNQFYVLVLATCAYLLTRHRNIHTKYYPWCPFCDHHGDGWDREIYKTPSPSGVTQ